MLGRVQENAATNLVRQSQTFGSWAVTAATITENAQVAPDGTLTADTLTDNATNAEHRALQNLVPIQANPTYSVR
jgi:hypothetical protein